jgi:short-subunit dehydrogenase
MTVVVITGASSGIGAAAARRFGASGATVILTARSGDKLAALAAEIGERAVAIPTDGGNPDDVAALGKRVLDEFGAPDVLIHSAGAGQWKTLPETSPAEAVQMMRAPYISAFNFTHAFLPAMLERRKGVIISINSPAAFLAWPATVGYAAARMALRGFHEALAQDLQGTGVSACHAVFGHVTSPYWDSNPGSLEKMPRAARTLPKMTPEDCARALTDLARNPRHTMILPWLLRVYVLCNALAPWLTRRLVRL